jgi:RNA polymerase sigma factor (sigma-70 family)
MPGKHKPVDKERAFSLLFRRQKLRCVARWLNRLGVPARDRLDVRQDVFLAAHRSFHAYDPEIARPDRWLNRITVHVASHYRDRAKHRLEELTPDAPDDIIDECPGPDERIEAAQCRAHVLQMLEELDIDLRCVLMAHDIDGVPMTEIAEQIGIPLSTAYKRRTRALEAFLSVVEERRLLDDDP